MTQRWRKLGVIFPQRDDFAVDGEHYRIHYAESADGIHFKCLHDPVVDVSESGWDSQMTCYPSVIRHEGPSGSRTLMLYRTTAALSSLVDHAQPLLASRGRERLVHGHSLLQHRQESMTTNACRRSARSSRTGPPLDLNLPRHRSVCVISSGRTLWSYCSAVRWPLATAASRRVMPSRWAVLAMVAALS